MTVREAMIQLRAAGLLLRRTGFGAEFRVSFADERGAKEEANAAYCDGLLDAVGTGLDMARRRNEHGDREVVGAVLMA